MEILDNQEHDFRNMDFHEPGENRNRFPGGVFVGLAFVAAGLILFLSYTGWISFGLRRILLSWQMLLIAIGIFSLIQKQKTQGIVLLFIGLFFLLPRLGGLPFLSDWKWLTYFSWKNMWPLLLVAIGLLIFVRSRSESCHYKNQEYHPYRHASRSFSRSKDGYVYYSQVFRGAENVFLESEFRGGEIETVFGGITLDLRKTNLQEGVSVLKLSAVFGGITLYVPPHWNIELRSECVFGDCKDRRPYTEVTDTYSKLVIKVECVFGGAEIR
ncbi:MAG: cell wall-active antibiotics response protein [Bacteroidales bacterium]|nr:cell wall-active antibiotics response protein [Bacteroidales bacterium]